MKDNSVYNSDESTISNNNIKYNAENGENEENKENEDEVIETVQFLSNSKKILTEADRIDIIRRGANSLTNLERQTRLFNLIRADNSYEFKKLLEFDINKDIINVIYKKTYLLHEACRRGMADIVTFLLFLNADCNLRDNNGMYPQHNAALSNCAILIDILSVFGNDFNVKDKRGNTPLHLAVMKKERSIINILLSLNVRILKNKEGKTPIDVCEDPVILNMLKNHIK